jgi:hypothetical protein
MQSDNRFLPPGLSASLSGPIGTLPESPISDIANSVFGDPEVVPLWFGEGDLVTPDFVREAAAKGLQAPTPNGSMASNARSTASASRRVACRQSCCPARCCSIPATTW